MSVSQLPSGRWRAQVHDPSAGHNVSVSKVLGGPGTFATKREAKAAREKARVLVGGRREHLATVGEWWATWTTDPLWRRPKESTNRHNAERTKAFAKKHENMPICRVNDDTISLWLRGGKRNGQVPALRAMFNDAARPAAGRLVDHNPFASLGISRGAGNRHKQPPTEQVARSFADHAHVLGLPGFAAWLRVACFTGMRPGELDALAWDRIDWEQGRIWVDRQWNSATSTFSSPKNGKSRWAILTPPAKQALVDERTQGDHEFCFVSPRGKHFTYSIRAPYWNAIRTAAGWSDTLYLGTRHFAGWYMVNVLGLDSEDVAFALGHEDGGELVRRLYGHRDRDRALDRVAQAYAQAGEVVDLDSKRKGTA